MGKIDHIDEHILGAFVDGELDIAGRELVLEAMHNDNATREQVYRLRRAKDLMKLGFEGARAATPAVQDFEPGDGWLTRWSGLAASIVLVVSLGAGYLGYQGGKQLAFETTPPVTALTQQHVDKVLLHISKSDPKQFSAALDYTRKFLDEHSSSGGQIAVVANAGGLDLLRAGVSPFEDQILEMIRDYPNVHFIACANSIRALRKKGVTPVIIENVDSTLPAMDKIIQYVQQGYTYIKVKSLMEI